MRMKRFFALLLLLHAGCLAARAQDLKKDTALGRQVFEWVESSMGIYHDPAIDHYVSALGQKLVSHLGDPLFPFEFHVADSPEPNAFAAPGGRIFLTRGLLSLPITEDELACVIAHEIIHTQNRHYINRKRSSIFSSIIALPGLLVGSIFQGPVGQAVASPFLGAGALINAQYSQGDELEADRQGIGLAAVAGYKPASLASILKRMEQAKEFMTGEEEKKSYLSTHPYTPKRVKQIRQVSSKTVPNTAKPLAKQDSFLLHFDGLPLGPNPEHGFIKDSTLYCAQFPLQVDSLPGWTYAVSPSTVGLISGNKEALLILETGKDSVTTAKYLSDLEAQIRKITFQSPGVRNDINWEGHGGGMIEYETSIRGRAVLIQLFAIDYQGKLLKMVAACYQDQKDELDRVLATVKPLKRVDIPNAEQMLLQTSAARVDETISSFADRLGVSKEVDIICLLNEKDPNEILREGEILKWIRRKAYTFR